MEIKWKCFYNTHCLYEIRLTEKAFKENNSGTQCTKLLGTLHSFTEAVMLTVACHQYHIFAKVTEMLQNTKQSGERLIVPECLTGMAEFKPTLAQDRAWLVNTFSADPDYVHIQVFRIFYFVKRRENDF